MLDPPAPNTLSIVEPDVSGPQTDRAPSTEALAELEAALARLEAELQALEASEGGAA